MMKVNFIYKGQIIPFEYNKNVKMEEIFEKFEIKVNIENNSVYYLYNGNKLNKEIKLEEIIENNNNLNNDINIIVNSIVDVHNNNLIKSKYIKCPKCKEENNSFNNEMYICNTCKINICHLCKSIHDKNHNIIHYEEKDFIPYLSLYAHRA